MPGAFGKALLALLLVLDRLTLLLAIPAIYYCLKLFRGLRNRLLWKIRRRLILAHIFIGAIPVFLVISIFVFSALLVYYQLSYYLISNQIGIHAAQIHAFSLSLRDGLQGLMAGKEYPGAFRPQITAGRRCQISCRRLSFRIDCSQFSGPGNRPDDYPVNQGANPDSQSDYQVPRWLTDREFSGLVIDDTQPDPRKARLYIRSFVIATFGPISSSTCRSRSRSITIFLGG